MQTINEQIEQTNYYDTFLFSQRNAEDVVSEVIENIILNGAKILHTHYLKTQINPYTAKTIGLELIMNSTWAKLPLGPQMDEEYGTPDDDLELPKIDSWANGALSVFDSMPIRPSNIPEHPNKKIQNKKESAKEISQIESQKLNETSEKVEKSSSSSTKISKSIKTKSKKNVITKNQNSETLKMTKIIELTKKASSKNITMDSDLNVIEIVEQKSLAASLIVPKVTTKRNQKEDLSKPAKLNRRIPIQKRDQKVKKKPLPKLLQVDAPLFEEEQTNVSVTENFKCSPGVTLKEGNFVRSKPLPVKPNELTRAQYQEYLREFKKSSQGEFLE